MAADEDFNYLIVRGLLRRNSNVDIVIAQEAGLSGAKDPRVLEWAAGEERVLFTHDVNTMIECAYQRIIAGEPTPGLFAVSQKMLISDAIEDMLLLAQYSLDGEWEGKVRYLPLQ
jgi:hypothetical protein